MNGLEKYISILRGMDLGYDKRPFQEVEKKMLILLDLISKNQIPQDILYRLLDIIKALDHKDFGNASQIQVDLMTNRYELTMQWISGLKRMIDLLRDKLAAPLPLSNG